MRTGCIKDAPCVSLGTATFQALEQLAAQTQERTFPVILLAPCELRSAVAIFTSGPSLGVSVASCQVHTSALEYPCIGEFHALHINGVQPIPINT